MKASKTDDKKKQKKKMRTNKKGKREKSGAVAPIETKQPTSVTEEDESDGREFPDLQDLMTEEDKAILKDVNDEEDECIHDVKSDGKDIPLSEISAFLKQLNFDKLAQPVESGSKVVSKQQILHKKGMEERDSGKTKANEEGHNVNGSDPGASPFLAERQKKESLKRVRAASKFLSTTKARKHLLIKPEDMWREEKLNPLPPHPPDAQLLNEAEQLAQKLMQDELSMYARFREKTKRSEAQWMKTVLASGTLSDKMAALTLLIQESPLHNMASLESLVSMAAKKGKREAMMAVDTLRDLFITGLLPDNRKLRSFNQQPLLDIEALSEGNVDKRDKLIMIWHFESALKKKYAEFLKALGDLSFDSLQASKEKAVSTMHQLLSGKPEQENILLSMLVNKLGDPVIKSKATYLLTKLVDEHPNMKFVIVREVQQLLYRPNVSSQAQYYAICFLVQLHLSKSDGDLASELIKIYFYFFQNYLKKGEVANKMMSALLTGVNRAYVYATANKEEIAKQMDEVYKIIPAVNFHTSVQALMLLFQVIDASTNAADRYYGCLYRKLADPALRNSSKQSIFMNLIFKSLKRDIVDRRIKAFMKRILQVYSQQPPQVICGILIILSQVLSERPSLLDVKHLSEGAWSDDEEEKFVDQPLPEEFDDHEPGKDNQTAKIKDEEGSDQELGRSTLDNKVNGVRGTWVHRVNFGGAGRGSCYDPYGRNPLYSRAELDCVWELGQLAKHYHPSVRLYADTLLQGGQIKYDGDPLKDFTLIRFLDRFVYKNPKKDSDPQSSMGKYKGPGPSGIRAVPVNSKEFLEAGAQGVPVDEKFFLQYFQERAKRKGEELSDEDSDADSVRDEEFDALLDGMEKDDGFDDLDLDFAGDKKKTQTSKKGHTGGGSDDDSDDDDEDEDDDDEMDLHDDALAAEFEKELQGLENDDSDFDDGDFEEGEDGGKFREEDIEFPPDEDDELAMMMMGSPKKNKRSRPKEEDDAFLDNFEAAPKKKKKKQDITDLFASAEEFAHLLEEDTEAGAVSLGGTGDFRNKDKAAQKQIKWESDRDRWIQDKGHRRHSFKGKPGKSGRGGPPTKGRGHKKPGQSSTGKGAHKSKPGFGRGKPRKSH